MNTYNDYSKIEILLKQKRFDQAESIIKNLLAQDFNNTDLLYLLGEIKIRKDQANEANEIANRGIGIEPDNSRFYFLKSRVDIIQKNLDTAESNIQKAIYNDPDISSYFALYGQIKMMRKDFEEALRLADEALELDPEDLDALNLRSAALIKLDRKEDSFITIEGALREDPENAYTHTNYGWGLLEQGEHKKALEHFKQALNSDPNYNFAQAGLLEAIKASNPIYRLFLKYAFFMGKLTAQYQWGVIIGFYVLFRFLSSLARNNEGLKPFLMPIVIALAIIAFSTWVITPISNLFLRFNKYGQLLLSKDEKLSSNFVAFSFLIFLIGIILFALTQDQKMMLVAVFGFTMMVPLSVIFSVEK
ncbi:MAG: tetratricopeptide repeat protein, partial [Bacteroidota bacterium]